MAIDKKLIQQVKQACARVKRAGISLGMEKLAGPFRNQPILPRRRAAPQQQYQAPAPQQPAVGNYLTEDDKGALREQWQEAPQGMQRFHSERNGEVFYAPNQEAANRYTGNNAAELGIMPGMRRDQSVQSLHDAMGQEANSGPAAGVDAPDTPLVGNTRTQYDTFKGYDDRTGAHAPPQGSGMDAAIEESKRIRAADPRNQVQPAPAAAPAAPAGKPYDRGIPFRPAPQFKSLSEGTVPLSTGSVGPSFGSETDPFSINPRNMASNAVNNVVNAAGNFGVGVQNAAGNAYDAAAFTAGNAADQGKRVMLDTINSPVAKAVGTATGGMGPGGYSYNRNAPGRAPAPPAPPPAIPNTMTAD